LKSFGVVDMAGDFSPARPSARDALGFDEVPDAEPAQPQDVLTPITESAVFLTACVDPGGEDTIADLLPDVAGLRRSVGFRAPDARLSCVVGIGSDLWDRSRRMWLCFKLARLIVDRLATKVRIADEVHGFKSFDERDLLGFVDGTENPEGRAAGAAVLIGDEDPGFAGGSYLIVQKYLHDLPGWNALTVEQRRRRWAAPNSRMSSSRTRTRRPTPT
jgi:putative iron-dependent peroxidase